MALLEDSRIPSGACVPACWLPNAHWRCAERWMLRSQGHLRAEARAAAGPARVLSAAEQPAAVDVGRHHQLLQPHCPQQAASRPQ